MRRVTFSVEPTRVEQSTNFDRLILDIETDGSISPAEALASAGDTLRSLVGLVADMSDEPQGLELGEVAAVGSGSPDLDLPIEDLDLSERPRNCLKRAQVNTIGELLDKTEDDLLAITNFGQKSLDEVIEKLDERGLSLRDPRLTPPRRTRRPDARTSPQGHALRRQRRAPEGHVRQPGGRLVAAEAIVTTEAKAKALRPVAEKLITKAKKGGLHNHRQVVAYLGDEEMAHKLLTTSAPATSTVPVATPASSSWVRARATTRRWPASSWSEPSHGLPRAVAAARLPRVHGCRPARASRRCRPLDAGGSRPCGR